jgi:hypothetical protein
MAERKERGVSEIIDGGRQHRSAHFLLHLSTTGSRLVAGRLCCCRFGTRCGRPTALWPWPGPALGSSPLRRTKTAHGWSMTPPRPFSTHTTLMKTFLSRPHRVLVRSNSGVTSLHPSAPALDQDQTTAVQLATEHSILRASIHVVDAPQLRKEQLLYGISPTKATIIPT